jgi:DNA mismatch endonuclease (patch repair protein)
MADVFTPEKRSDIMSRIRSSGTTPEARLWTLVREALGGRWRIDRNVRTLPGQPDVLVPSLRLAIFADGCFYHGCPEHGHVPKSNVEYWLTKLTRNRRRDRARRRALRRMGFAVWRLWEHELRGRSMSRTQLVLARRLKARLELRRSRKEVRMPRFQQGDYVKAGSKDEGTGESERMWVLVDSCDDEAGVLFGRLDNEPVVGTGLRVGDVLAVGYGKVVEHRKAKEFQKQ